MKKLKYILSIVGVISLLTGCGPKFERLNDLDLKINNYEAVESVKDISFAIAQPEFIVETKLSPSVTRALSKRLEYDANVISCHLTSELTKLVIGKGITVSDTFENRNAMTFTQKRDTSALFYPRVIITLIEESMTNYEGSIPLSSNGDIKIKAKVEIVMTEPLSGERIWVKTIPINGNSVGVNYSGYLISSSSPTQVQDKIKSVAMGIDKLLTNIDHKILDAATKYITIEEFRFLNDDIKKLKDIKRY